MIKIWLRLYRCCNSLFFGWRPQYSASLALVLIIAGAST